MSVEKLKGLLTIMRNIADTGLRAADATTERSADDLARRNAEMLSSGQNNEGRALRYLKPRVSVLAGVYTKAYKRKKDSTGGQTGFVDLKLSGGFHAGLRVDRVALGVFRFTNEDSDLLGYLQKNYGPGILGITSRDMIGFVNNDIAPAIISDIENKISAL